MNKWDVFELSFNGKSDKNPFVCYSITGEFKGANETKRVSGFYDGDGVYKIRFMPSFEGEYSYRVFGSFSDEEYRGTFEVTCAESHGPVRAAGVHFVYEDGTPYYSIGTTCYAWAAQREELQKQTLETLKNSVFNKIRFCIFPKHYDYNFRDPYAFPYIGVPIDNTEITKDNFWRYTITNNKNYKEENSWDFSLFNAEYFRNLDTLIGELCKMGIEADIILFHPYDRWGFSNMPDWANDLYLRYVTARYSAYRNIWWSLSNEYDLNPFRTIGNWEHYAKIIVENDPYGHLRSIHNCMDFYDYARPWVTHCSIQRQSGSKELDYINEWARLYRKPIVIDEMCYEGNIEHDWGNISGELMTQRMWECVVSGGYPGHSECFETENLWWSHGGELYGESHKRFGLLLDVMKKTEGGFFPCGYRCAVSKSGKVKLWYFKNNRPSYRVIDLGNTENRISVIDTWNMTVEDRGVMKGRVKVMLPGKENMAILAESE